MPSKLLIFIPTYNESKNVRLIFDQLLTRKLPADILFLDDHSPDGTGEIIDELSRRYPFVHALHRSGKLGIGSAHKEGIRWAYEHGYETLITMDCDFSHSPEYLAEFLSYAPDYDIVLGSRYLKKDSLKEWNIIRKSLTSIGHFLTVTMLKLPHDATGAYRLYQLKRISRSIFERVESGSYSFFFESLFLLYRHNYKIKEFPIHLPKRTYGHSKMTIETTLISLRQLCRLYSRMVQKTEKPVTVCTRCILDTTVPDIRFNAEGVCHYCHIHDELEKEYALNSSGQKKFEALIAKIKKDGRGKSYDIIVGVSGGRDSTFALYTAVRLGLRVLAVHFDNGWNSEIAVTNIKSATQKLNVDLQTFVIDWEEFKDLQIAFLKASVSDAEIPTDVAIHGILHKIAAQENIRYVVFAHSFRTEGVAPLGWTYMDGRYISDIHRRFGTKKLSNYPNMKIKDVLYYKLIKRIEVVPLLVYVPYDQKDVEEVLKHELGWGYYGGHHHESYYTHFFQSYYLPKKFNIDKRKIEYSALIRSGQMKREKAVAEIAGHPYPYDPELVKYTITKLGLTREEFDRILASPNKTFHDFSTYYPLMRWLRWPLKVGAQLNLIPKHLYLKFLG